MATKEGESSGVPGTEQARPGPGFRRRVVVKFKEHVQVSREDTARALELQGVGPWNALAAQFEGITLEPLLSFQPEQFSALADRAHALDPSFRAANLGAYFAVNLPLGTDPEELVRALLQWDSVAIAYVEPPPVEPPLVHPSDDPRFANQGYLDPAPDGIDAEYAWTFAGGDGAGQALVDMEWGWTFNHEDLAAHGITLISGLNHSYFFHGTGVLGEIAAVDNALGCVGITPALASIRCVGQHREGGGYSTAQPILDAIAVMQFGDVLLLEAQTNLFGYNLVPVEIEPAVFDVIQLATSLGIVVVEAGGNGGIDLDTVVNPAGQQIFNRASPDFHDSGAIIVGAASATAPHARLGFSCYGSRIDCYGWGESVDTLSSDATNTATDLYTTGFNGTSSASPIVTGAALAVQGLMQAASGGRLAPWQLRMILSDPANGTSSQDPVVDRIGAMPNLRAIIDGMVLNLSPDIYLRDFVGDNGDAHLGAIASSPDIILRQAAVADPQAAFGAGSGTENDVTLGYEAESGQDNFVYVRVRNRGGTAAANVTATVYWAPPATLLTPDLWTLLGATTLPSVPTGDLLTVSSPITWPAAAIPAPGHYCFVSILNTPRDPGPTPADLMDWNNFTTFIRNNNNVTWRNFNVVNNIPPPGAEPPGYVALPFIAAGAPDRARLMQLEIVPRLPAGSEIMLELSPEFAERLHVCPHHMTGAGAHSKPSSPRVVHIVMNPCGRVSFPPIAFPAKARIPLRLLVKIPEAMQKHQFELFARQTYEGEEVGRVTWRLAPPRLK
jgi:serine protease